MKVLTPRCPRPLRPCALRLWLRGARSLDTGPSYRLLFLPGLLPCKCYSPPITCPLKGHVD